VTQFEPADPAPPGVDPTVASPARVWNYWVGGTDNFPVDRETGERVRDAMPFMPMLARYARRFLADAVRQLAVDHGVRQFLDIGTGMPTAGNTHQVAQEIAPGARVVYVDNDPSVLAQAGALLTSSPAGRTDYVDADLRDVDAVLAGLDRLKREHDLAMLMVEQHARIALQFAETAVILDRGEIVYSGPSRTLAEQPDRLAELIGVGGHGH